MSAVFDAVAQTYDAAEEQNPITIALRARSLAALESAFPRGSRLLDVGAGTGTDAVALTLGGRRLVATDPSPRMLAVLRAKAAAAGCAVPTHRLTARELGGLVAAYGPGAFDGAYSSFGALNAETDLRPVAGALEALVRPGGRVVLGLMGRWPLLEIAGLAASGRPAAALRRARGSASPAVAGAAVAVRYHTAEEVARAFGHAFAMEHQEALGLLVPPPAAWPRVRSRRLVAAAAAADRHLAGVRALSRLGDHVLLVLRRRG